MNETTKEHEQPTGPFADFQAASPIHQNAKRRKYAGKDDPVCTPVEDGKYHRPQTSKTGVNAYHGTWPGDETEDELMQSMRDYEDPQKAKQPETEVKIIRAVKYINYTSTVGWLIVVIFVLLYLLGMEQYGDLVVDGVF